MIDAKQLEEWRAIAGAATVGPWLRVREEVRTKKIVGEELIADCGGRDLDPHEIHSNAAFIAAARTAVPALLAEVERLQTELEREYERNMPTKAG